MAVALEDIDALDAEITRLTAPLQIARDALQGVVNEYVLKSYEPGEGYVDDAHRLTVVQSHTRKWNPDKLRKLVPMHIFKNITEVKVIPAKVDEYVRAGKIERADIEEAFEEHANAPYIKATTKAGNSGASEAAALAERLG